MGLPDRDTGGLTGLRGRAGGGVGGALLAAGLGTALSSTTGWGASFTMRLAGATLPLEAIVALCLARTVSVGWAPAARSGATLAASLAAGAIGTGAGRAGAAGRASGADRRCRPSGCRPSRRCRPSQRCRRRPSWRRRGDHRLLDGRRGGVRLQGDRPHARGSVEGLCHRRGGGDWVGPDRLRFGRRRGGRRRRRLEQSVALRPAPNAVGLGLNDARGMGLDPNTEREAEIKRLLIGQSELLGELVDADLAWQNMPPSGRGGATGPSGGFSRRAGPRCPKPIYLAPLHVGPECTREGAAALRRLQAGDLVTQPGAAPIARPQQQHATGADAHAPHLRRRLALATADARADRAQTLARPAGSAACSSAEAAHASALTASLPSAGCHICWPVSRSMIHSPSAQSTSP